MSTKISRPVSKLKNCMQNKIKYPHGSILFKNAVFDCISCMVTGLYLFTEEGENIIRGIKNPHRKRRVQFSKSIFP